MHYLPHLSRLAGVNRRLRDEIEKERRVQEGMLREMRAVAQAEGTKDGGSAAHKGGGHGNARPSGANARR
jgi:hypothetical protein